MEEWYYVRNGQQQGPVHLETLRDLAEQGSLSPQDLVWNASMADWTPASAVDGIFSRAIGHGSSSPPSQVLAGSAADTGALSEIEPGSEPLDIGGCISRGFELTKRHFLPLLGIMVVYIFVSIVVAIALGVMDKALGMGSTKTVELFGQRSTQHTASILNQIISNIFSIYLSLGLVRIGLNIVDGKPFELGQLFGGGSLLIKAVLSAILFFLMIMAVMIPTIILVVLGANSSSLILLAIPVGLISIVAIIWLSLRFSFYMAAIVDKGLGPIEALNYSSQITTSQRLSLFLLSLVMCLIILGGLLCLIIGVIFAIPVTMLAWMVAYRWMQYGSRVVQD